jgi:hypothetical protein
MTVGVDTAMTATPINVLALAMSGATVAAVVTGTRITTPRVRFESARDGH